MARTKRPPRDLTDEQRDAVAANLGLVGFTLSRLSRSLFWRRGRRTLDDADAYQEGCLGLIAAARAHDPARGKLSTLAAKCVRHAVLGAVPTREPPQRLRPEHFAPLVWRDDDAERRATGEGYDPAQLRAALDALAPAERELITAVYFRGESMAAVARRSGVSREAVRLRVKKVLARLRERMASDA